MTYERTYISIGIIMSCAAIIPFIKYADISSVVLCMIYWLIKIMSRKERWKKI